MSADAVETMLPAAAALAVAVCDYDPAAVAEVLIPLDRDQLYALTIALAANIDLDQPIRCEPSERAQTDDLAAATVRIAARMFGTDPTLILSTNRRRHVVDARAAAMYACKLLGMSSPAIGVRFDRDHSTVVYAWSRVGESERLRTAGQQIAIQCGWTRTKEAA